MPTQKALVLAEEFGQFVVVDNWPMPPTPGPGQVLIKVKATALNPVDWKMRQSGLLVQEYPIVSGWDFSGDVEVVGEGVEGLGKGDRVVALGFPPTGFSGFQQYTLMPADLVCKIPDSLDYAEAASIPLGYASAAIGLLAASPTGAGIDPTCALDGVSFAGQPAFVFGGSSSVGQFAIQMLRTLSFSPIITYASSKHTEFLKSLGATHVIARSAVRSADVPAAVRKLAGGAPFKIAYDAISEGGTVVAILAPVKDRGDVDGKKLIYIVASPHIHREFGVRMVKLLAKQLEEGVIQPNRIEKLSGGLAGIVDGLARMENNAVSGVKLVVFPQETA
ncbi:GroES-like protein [Roridomyces roridus]|uniref:GroES-like protein n=1 Tax=Roridomyces roridus TaxID=1738132 RepID=A0AAD7FZ65_9AGAR|nr:GroES-like protein [Roridomyces roridus]